MDTKYVAMSLLALKPYKPLGYWVSRKYSFGVFPLQLLLIGAKEAETKEILKAFKDDLKQIMRWKGVYLVMMFACLWPDENKNPHLAKHSVTFDVEKLSTFCKIYTGKNFAEDLLFFIGHYLHSFEPPALKRWRSLFEQFESCLVFVEPARFSLTPCTEPE